jgi:hypothetical protein
LIFSAPLARTFNLIGEKFGLRAAAATHPVGRPWNRPGLPTRFLGRERENFHKWHLPGVSSWLARNSKGVIAARATERFRFERKGRWTKGFFRPAARIKLAPSAARGRITTRRALTAPSGAMSPGALYRKEQTMVPEFYFRGKYELELARRCFDKILSMRGLYCTDQLANGLFYQNSALAACLSDIHQATSKLLRASGLNDPWDDDQFQNGLGHLRRMLGEVTRFDQTFLTAVYLPLSIGMQESINAQSKNLCTLYYSLESILQKLTAGWDLQPSSKWDSTRFRVR